MYNIFLQLLLNANDRYTLCDLAGFTSRDLCWPLRPQDFFFKKLCIRNPDHKSKSPNKPKVRIHTNIHKQIYVYGYFFWQYKSVLSPVSIYMHARPEHDYVLCQINIHTLHMHMCVNFHLIFICVLMQQELAQQKKEHSWLSLNVATRHKAKVGWATRHKAKVGWTTRHKAKVGSLCGLARCLTTSYHGRNSS